jgi:hypothetical protein
MAKRGSLALRNYMHHMEQSECPNLGPQRSNSNKSISFHMFNMVITSRSIRTTTPESQVSFDLPVVIQWTQNLKLQIQVITDKLLMDRMGLYKQCCHTRVGAIGLFYFVVIPNDLFMEPIGSFHVFISTSHGCLIDQTMRKSQTISG